MGGTEVWSELGRGKKQVCPIDCVKVGILRPTAQKRASARQSIHSGVGASVGRGGGEAPPPTPGPTTAQSSTLQHKNGVRGSVRHDTASHVRHVAFTLFNPDTQHRRLEPDSMSRRKNISFPSSSCKISEACVHKTRTKVKNMELCTTEYRIHPT